MVSFTLRQIYPLVNSSRYRLVDSGLPQSRTGRLSTEKELLSVTRMETQ